MSHAPTHTPNLKLKPAAAPTGDLPDALRALDAHLAELHAAMKQLLELTCEKLAAMRKADATTLQACVAREEIAVRDVLTHEQQRNAVFARVAQLMLAPDLAQHGVSAIAERAPEPWGSALRARSLALRHTAEELQRKNRIAAHVAHNLHSHIRGVFAAVAEATQESVGYGHKGKPETSSIRCMVDAVG